MSGKAVLCFVDVGFAFLQDGEEVDAAAVKQPIEKATLGERVAFWEWSGIGEIPSG